MKRGATVQEHTLPRDDATPELQRCFHQMSALLHGRLPELANRAEALGLVALANDLRDVKLELTNLVTVAILVAHIEQPPQ